MRAAILTLILLLPGLAAAQSSNSSSNCSDGVCTRIESWRPDGGRGPGWTRAERWREDDRGWQGAWPPSAWGWAPPRGWHGRDDDRPRRRGHGRDEDD